MKIAMIAPLIVSVPPLFGGGAEQIADELVRGLAKRGHNLTIFCSGQSTISGEHIERVEMSPYPTLEHLEENRTWEVALFEAVLSRQDEFDIIHFNYEPIVLRHEQDGKQINFLDLFRKPVVCTFHNITTVPEVIDYYRSRPSLYRHTMIFVSKNQQSHVPFFRNSQVIYNAIPLEKFPVQEQKENYLLFLGRITRVKGILEAITVAKKAHVPLVIAAAVGPADRVFYESEVKPHIDGTFVHYVGKVNFSEKIEYLKKARCLLFPIGWEEPFGLVMIEALACGTPVIAFGRGSVPEIIEDGLNGYIVETVDEMASAVKHIQDISAHACRKSVEKRFSTQRMVDEYEQTFREIIVRQDKSHG